MKYSILRLEKQTLREKTVACCQLPVFSQQQAVGSRQFGGDCGGTDHSILISIEFTALV